MHISLNLDYFPVPSGINELQHSPNTFNSLWDRFLTLRVLQPITGQLITEIQISLTLFPYKRQRPCEDIHEVWKPVRMRGTVELPDVHDIVFIFQYSS